MFRWLNTDLITSAILCSKFSHFKSDEIYDVILKYFLSDLSIFDPLFISRINRLSINNHDHHIHLTKALFCIFDAISKMLIVGKVSRVLIVDRTFNA